MPKSFLITRERDETQSENDDDETPAGLKEDDHEEEKNSLSSSSSVEAEQKTEIPESNNVFRAVKYDHDYHSSQNQFFDLSRLAEISLVAEGRLADRPELAKIVQEVRSCLSAKGSKTKLIKSEGHVCGDCGKAYSTSSNLARHRQTHRSLLDKKAKRCHFCSKVYVSMPAFSMHMRTHNQTCVCKICGKSFSRPWLLQGHHRTHTGERPYSCTLCPKAFADKSNLRAHLQTHSKNKPYTCSICGKAFALKSYLYKHEESTCLHSK